MRSKSKVVWVGFDARWYNRSGVGTYVAELLNALAPLQGDFRLLVYESPGNPVPGLANVERIPLAAGKYSPLGQIALWRRSRKDQLDVFHSPFYPVPVLASCPVVVTVHDLIPFLFDGSNRLKRPLVKAGYRLAVQKARGIICTSHQTASDVRRLLGVADDRIKV
ncbi:MAG TPA: glycosyltransferase, partial [Alphaproteobacteria bacterium]|nr:glycosyltransferase [Alphaproteobacteria bacterium]